MRQADYGSGAGTSAAVTFKTSRYKSRFILSPRGTKELLVFEDLANSSKPEKQDKSSSGDF
jgi:mevalonate kinase